MHRSRFLAVGLIAFVLAGCVSTQTISGISALGYERFGNFRGSEAYVCPKPKCASDNVVVVHKSEPLSARDRQEIKRIGDPSEAASISAALNQLAGSGRNKDVTFGSPQRTTISGREAFSISLTGAGKKPDGAFIIVPDGNKAQLFAGLSQKRADGTRGAISLARLWVRSQR